MRLVRELIVESKQEDRLNRFDAAVSAGWSDPLT